MSIKNIYEFKRKPILSSSDVEQLDSPTNVLADTAKIQAFNPDDDELAGVSKDELLSELAVVNQEIPIVEKVSVDQITGEECSVKKTDENSILSIDSLQDINPEEIKKQLNILTKQSLSELIPDTYSDEEIGKIITRLEEKLINVSHTDIKSMTAQEAELFIGNEIYSGIKEASGNPSKIVKQFLMDMKNAIVEVRDLLDTVNEVKIHMKFLEDYNIEKLQKDIKDSLNIGEGLYKSEYHKYIKYLQLYIDALKETGGYESNSFILEEIRISESHISAVTDALSFKPILDKAKNLKSKIFKDFNDDKYIQKLIYNFIGNLNNDPNIVISFPVPKHMTENVSQKTEVLVGSWLLFLELIFMTNQFPVLKELTHSEYYELSNIILTGNYDKENIKEELLYEFAHTNHISKLVIKDSKKMAIILSYILAKTFKIGNLNTDPQNKYILSYTMNILSSGLKDPYAGMISDLVIDIISILK